MNFIKVLFNGEKITKIVLYTFNYEDVPSIIQWYTLFCGASVPDPLNRFFVI